MLQCPRCCGLGAVLLELKGRATDFCAERVCIYRLTCENSCCELVTGSCFHTRLTYADCKAIKLHSHVGIGCAVDSDIEVSELAFPLHPIMCVVPHKQPPSQPKAVVVLTWLDGFHTWT